MTIPMRSPDPGPELETRRRVDGRTLWSGGVATAVVAGLIALVGILVCRWLFKVPILSPQRDGAWGDASTAGYVFASAAVALAATGMMHLLLLSTPYPRVFFGWIIGLAGEVSRRAGRRRVVRTGYDRPTYPPTRTPGDSGY